MFYTSFFLQLLRIILGEKPLLFNTTRSGIFRPLDDVVHYGILKFSQAGCALLIVLARRGS